MTLRGNRRRMASPWPPTDIIGSMPDNPILQRVAFGVAQSTDTPRRAICAQLGPAAKIVLAQRQAAQSRDEAKEHP